MGTSILTLPFPSFSRINTFSKLFDSSIHLFDDIDFFLDYSESLQSRTSLVEELRVLPTSSSFINNSILGDNFEQFGHSLFSLDNRFL